MGARQRISRRQVLAISAAAGSLAIGGYRGAAAQAPKRIERYAPELDGIISSSEPIQELASGTGGTLGPTEGPLWWKEGGYLLYRDIHSARLTEWRERALAGAATALKERERDDRDDEIVRLKSKVGEITMDNELRAGAAITGMDADNVIPMKK
jgi:hypothetical protein